MVKKNNSTIIDLSVILVCVFFSLAGILINLNRFWQYESGYYDFGIFDQAIWKIAHFQAPIIDHFLVSGKISLADHFHPSLYLLAPIYWFTSRSEALFIIQDIFVGLSGFIIYLTGIKILKNKLLSLSVLITYFLYVGLQNAIFSDFHEVTAMTLFLALTYWAIINGNKKLFFLFFLITLGFKESLFLLGIGISFFAFWLRREWKKTFIFSGIFSLLYGLVVIKIIIPFFSGGIYWYSISPIWNIRELFLNFFFPIIKIKTIFLTLFSFGFLPLLVPQSWLIFIFNFGSRFLANAPTRWDLGLHYNAEIAPTLAVSSLLALNFIRQKLSKRITYLVAIIIVINSFILYRFVLHGPFMLASNPIFYEHTKKFTYLDELTAKIPKNASVLAQNNLAAKFLHQEVWILRENYRQHKAEYIIMDLRPGQNPNNFLGIENKEKLLKNILRDKDYRLFYHQGNRYIFKRAK